MAFEVLPDRKSVPIGHQFVQCHMVFDVKMEDFRCNARHVAGGHMPEVPATITYASVVSRETVGIALMIFTINDLEVRLGDILNACVQAPVKEKVLNTFGPKYDKDAGKASVIVRASSVGEAFRSHLARCMQCMGYQSCKIDPDVWL